MKHRYTQPIGCRARSVRVVRPIHLAEELVERGLRRRVGAVLAERHRRDLEQIRSRRAMDRGAGQNDSSKVVLPFIEVTASLRCVSASDLADMGEYGRCTVTASRYPYNLDWA